jgi:hypothetical protein
MIHRLKVLPYERAALVGQVVFSAQRTMTDLIRSLAFGSDEHAQILRDRFGCVLARVAKPAGRTKRVGIAIRLNAGDMSQLANARQRGETRSETLRRLLGLAPISPRLRAAARASSRRGNSPTVSPELAAGYWRLLSVLTRLRRYGVRRDL